VKVLRTAVAPLLFAANATAAWAHPIHEVVQNAYLTLAPRSVELQLELTAGPKVAGRIAAALDADGDKKITPAEAGRYAGRVLRASRLTVDGQPIALRLVGVDVPSYAALLGAYDLIRIRASAARRSRLGPGMLAYRNSYNPSESRCDANIFLTPTPGTHYYVITQSRGLDGRDFRVRYMSSRG
jgi:hypothetical protein